jgi:hypothetical protein
VKWNRQTTWFVLFDFKLIKQLVSSSYNRYIAWKINMNKTVRVQSYIVATKIRSGPSAARRLHFSINLKFRDYCRRNTEIDTK